MQRTHSFLVVLYTTQTQIVNDKVKRKLVSLEHPDFVSPYPQSDISDLPDSVDWREFGAVSSVDHQGKCDSCWAHTACATLEGHLQIKTGLLLKLSSQELISCRDGDLGCRTGSAAEAFSYVKRNGIGLDAKIPFTSRSGEWPPCRDLDKSEPRVKKDVVKGYKTVPFIFGDESPMMRAVAKGPVFAVIRAGPAFDTYSGGLYKTCEYFSRGKGYQYHGVCVVGYTKYQGKPVWIVKNSFSEDWGDEGYIYIERLRQPWGNSGILLHACYPILVGDDTQCDNDLDVYVEPQLLTYLNWFIDLINRRVLDGSIFGPGAGLLEAFHKTISLTGMSERKSEGSGKPCLTKPPVNIANENIEECRKKKNGSFLVSPHVNGNLAVPADSVVEIGTVEVEYIESENLSNLEDVDTCLKAWMSSPLVETSVGISKAGMPSPREETYVGGSKAGMSSPQAETSVGVSKAESGGNGLVTRRMTGQGGADEFSMKIPNNKVAGLKECLSYCEQDGVCSSMYYSMCDQFLGY